MMVIKKKIPYHMHEPSFGFTKNIIQRFVS